MSPGAVSQPRFVRHSGRLDPRTWSSLKERATRQSLTPSGLLLAAFAEILTRWSKSPRFGINVTLLNRLPLHSQVGQIVGDFTSLVPLEVDNSGCAPFQARAARIQSQLLEDLEHRYLTGVEIMRKAARTQGKTSATTLPVVFTSLLNQDREGGSPSKTLWMGEVVYGISQTPQVWLDHQVFEEDGVLVFHWDAVDELFPEGLLPDMFNAYCRLLRTLALEEHAWTEPLGDLIPEYQLAEREAINATGRVLPESLLQDLFAEKAKLHPDQTAVVSMGRRLSYGELDRLSNQVAHRLRVLGARPNKLVAVVMEKGWEQVVAVLGILKSGAGYLPIDPALPRDRFWYLLEHGEVEVALSQAHLDRRLKWPQSVRRLYLDETAIGSLFDLPPESVQNPDDLAYVIYTSGSTGLPKGVMVDHRGAVNTITDINRRFGVGPSDKVIALSDLSFDLSVYDVFGTLAAGATLVIPDADRTRDPATWLDLVRRENVTVWNSVPALMEMMVAYAGGQNGLVPSLRLALLSGDWISVKLPERVREMAPELQLISLGGATEASIWSIYFPIEQVDPEWRSIPYGRPLQNQKFDVLDGLLKPCPVWMSGELYIGGIGLARGYWRDEEKTSRSFITHPATGERLYRTGDLGRYLPGGNIEFLGREDSQVKVQGHRIELGEIEAVMAQHPAIQAVAARAVGNAQGSKRLVAYVVAKSDVSGAELSGFLGEKLPSYMIPSRFIKLEAMPLTANGKIDRAALPDPPQPDCGAGADSAAPDNAIEARIATIVAVVLGLDQVKSDADLFELGATSLDLIRIARSIEGELGCPPPIADFFHYPTVAGIAELTKCTWLDLT